MEQSSSRERRGPQVYVHLEFGLSWNSKPPKNHEVTYKSRGLRERSPAFPRQVPAPNTNYLAAIHDFEQRHSRHPNRVTQPGRTHHHHHHHHHHHVGGDHQLQEYYQAGYHVPVRPARQPTAHQEQRRSSRAESSSSHERHERGHSAPPPIGENPWDVSVEQSHIGGSSAATAENRAPAVPPDPWKALPHPPSQYRLGEDGMPWSSWSWPMGFDPATTTPQDDDVVMGGSPSTITTQAGGYSSTQDQEQHISPFDASPLSVSVYSPSPSGRRDVETGRARELGALSAAMMTVDNGFENQWWNQGPRESVQLTTTQSDEPGDEPSEPQQTTTTAAATANNAGLSRNRWSARSLGWAVAETPATTSATIRSIHPSDMVSPITAGSDRSPPPSYGQSRYPHQMQRSMSTRSEELWFTATERDL